MAIDKQKIRIGDLLVKNNVISSEQLQSAVERQKQTGERLGRALIELGFVKEDQFLSYLSQQLQIPYVDLRRHKFDASSSRELCTALPSYRSIRSRWGFTGWDGGPDGYICIG